MAESEKAKKFFTSISAVAAAATVAGVIASVSTLFSVGKDAALDATFNEMEARIESIVARDLSSLRSEIDAAISEVLDANQLPEETEIALRFQGVNQRLDMLSSQMGIVEVIESAVTENPERAMSIPILRKDVDLLRTDLVDDLETIRGEIDRVYDLGKWFLGLIATMAIGVMGLAIGNLIKSSE